MNSPRNFFTRLGRSLFGSRPVPQEIRDNFFFPGESAACLRDRSTGNFRSIIEESLEAWRSDPLARRIVSLTTQFSVGRGFRIGADDPAADEFLHEFWTHPLNRMDARLTEWSDELCRTGNLFILLSSDSSGMSYVRAIPAGLIEEIVSMENDIEQPSLFRLREVSADGALRIPELKTVLPAAFPESEGGEAMLHFTVNRPIGAQWGEPDLAPLLTWLERYREWLKDRWELNHYRSSFVYVVKAPALNEPLRKAREQQLNQTRPKPGTIVVAGEDEDWQALHPNFDSSDANLDGLALKKMIAAGAGIPVSFLAEPGSASRAESGGMEDSACRNFRQRQQQLLWMTETVLRQALLRGARVRRELDRDAEIHVYGDDIAAPGMTEGGIL
ncbi:MAG: hypothetical protein IJI57_07155 [Flexilinea sp.]|nr:hypothetical protein [Flexilinea sp.]